MAKFKVIEVVDGDTFDVIPQWEWKGSTGSRVRPVGYDALELVTAEGNKAKQKLANLTEGKKVELGNAYRIDRGRLVCEVYYNGKNLKDYFPEYQ
jgi:endonuclease YncB( thermonuclease family)